jgi:hypothetical protein
MANLLNWSLGHHGKGNYYADSSISTWNIDGNGNPHHQEVAGKDDKRPVFLFYISPEGAVFDGGVGFNNSSAIPDEEIINDITDADPYLYDASDDPALGAEPAPARVETPTGYGHAWGLMNAKTAGTGAMHSEYKIPRKARQQIRRWVDGLEWPEGAEKEDARKYHVTVLTLEEYCQDFEKYMRQNARRELTFRSTGFDIFEDAVVLRLDCDPWFDMAVDWGEKAENRELGPHRFPGGPKAHVTIGYTVDGKWPQGLPNPNIEFTTKMFNINLNRTSGVRVGPDGPYDNMEWETCPGCGGDDIVMNAVGGRRHEWACRSCGKRFGTEHPRLFAPEQPSPPIADPRWNAENPPRSTQFESSAADDLRDWVLGISSEPEDPISIHHNREEDLIPQAIPPASLGPHIDPPSHPYKPYDWAQQEKTSGLDDEASDLSVPPDWEHKQRRVRELEEQAIDAYKQLSYAIDPTNHMNKIVQDLVQKLDLLGLDDQSIYDIANGVKERIMDSPDLAGTAYSLVPEEPQKPEEWMPAMDKPMTWRNAPQMNKWKAEPDEQDRTQLDQALAQAKGKLKGGQDYDKVVEWFETVIEELGLPVPEVMTEYEPSLEEAYRGVADTVPQEWGNNPPKEFLMPQGWQRTPAEEQALIYQHMNDQAQAVMEGRRGPAAASTLLEGRLGEMSVPPDRAQEAVQQFQQMLQQWQNQQAVQQEWTAALMRLARSIVGCFECGIDHPSEEQCPEVELPKEDDGYQQSQREWYDRAWSEPGSPTPYPPQPMHWRHDHAPDVSLSSFQAAEEEKKRKHKQHANPDSWQPVERGDDGQGDDEEGDSEDGGGDGGSSSA